MHFGIGDTGVVVDGGVDIGLAHQRVPPLVLGLVRRGGPVLLALPAADVTPAPAVGDVAELLHIDVQHGPGVIVFVATDGFPSRAVNVRQPVQAGVDQDPVDRGRRDAEPARELNRPLAQT